jgi:hypothetical protein
LLMRATNPALDRLTILVMLAEKCFLYLRILVVGATAYQQLSITTLWRK